MPTKTDRILSYLPGTFRISPKPDVLHALIDTFGKELLAAENSLSAVTAAHWVDYADRAAKQIDDLAKLAALYGLAPLREADLTGEPRQPGDDLGEFLETVEEFREHLKRYIRTFLESTVTVQGCLRVTAEALALQIADAYEEMDCWWTRQSDEIITVEARRDDAAQAVFGSRTAIGVGSPARPAQITGSVELGQAVDLRGAHVLRLQVDGGSVTEIDLLAGVETPSSVPLTAIRDAINGAFPRPIAHLNGSVLTLQSPTTGPSSRLTVQDGVNDAADRLLGLTPWVYRGSDAAAAQVIGSVELSTPLDLRQQRYLRLEIDRRQLVEIDCASANPEHPEQITPQQVCEAINHALNLPNFATLHEGRLKFTSPTIGFNSSIAAQAPAAQNATTRLLGEVNSFYIGQDPQPAKVQGKRDLNNGVDLRDRSLLRFRINGAVVTVNCAGADPANTQLNEIVTAINLATQSVVASQDGRFLTLASRQIGAAAQLTIEPLATGDATDAILGLIPCNVHGAAATAARISTVSDLTQLVDLKAAHSLFLGALQIAVDGGTPMEVLLRVEIERPDAAQLAESISLTLRDAINRSLPNLASVEGEQLILTSPTTGSASRLEVLPLETQQRRRFVTRAAVLNEATQAIFGFLAQEAQGIAATSAQVIGTIDLSRGIDLQQQRRLRLTIDAHAPIEIDCAGLRPRATSLQEVVDKINAAVDGSLPNLQRKVASHDGSHLILTSPAEGSDSRIAIAPSQVEDALLKVLGVEPGTFRGQDPTRVNFIGTVDLSQGIDLPAQAAIALSIDEAEPHQITLTEAEPAHKTFDQLLLAINTQLNQVIAHSDGKRLIVTSAKTGETSRVTFAVPTGTDVTSALFGITPPRAYQGAPALSAQVTGKELSSPIDLETTRFLRLTVDTTQATVDCAARANNPKAVTPEEIKNAINAAFNAEIASVESGHLRLRSPTTGQASKLVLESHTSADVRPLLFGSVEPVAQGQEATPAVITSKTDLASSVKLDRRRSIRLAVDGQRPVDIDVAGAAAATTFADEIAAAINAVYPNVASVTSDGKLQLASPTNGETSRLSLLPSRYLELIEYPPQVMQAPDRSVRHGDRWSITNDGVADATAEIQLLAPQGTVGPTLTNSTIGWRVRLFTLIDAGERVRLQPDARVGLTAVITAADGKTTRSVPSSQILVGPVGTRVWVPFRDNQPLRHDSNSQITLQLNNPLAANIVRLRALDSDTSHPQIQVTVQDSTLTDMHIEDTVDGDSVRWGRVQRQADRLQLVDATGATIAHLQPGPHIDLSAYENRAAIVRGRLYSDETAVMVVHQISALFDVTVGNAVSGSDPEPYPGVTIGSDITPHTSLSYQINIRSQLVVADDLNKGSVLTLPPGKSDWLYLDCYSSRFDQAEFDRARFAGEVCACTERGVFNVSRFTGLPAKPSSHEDLPPEPFAAVFTATRTIVDPPVIVGVQWLSHRPGSFQVNLPADLPARFGGRFNQARFSQEKDKPELYVGAVTEETGNPEFDAAHSIVHLINPQSEPTTSGSNLVRVEILENTINPPLGWEAIQLPFRKPQHLTLGNEQQPAQIYLKEEGLTRLIKLQAIAPGAWGNDITISFRQSGQAMYDIAIRYNASRFENARQLAKGNPLPALTQDLLQPGAIGLLQAKAAGVQVDVTRDGIP